MRYLIILLFLLFSSISYSQSRIKLEKKGGVFYIPCVINNINMKLIYDTGASDVFISLKQAKQFVENGPLTIDDIIGFQEYQIASGDIVVGMNIILKKIVVGDRVLTNVEASVSDNEESPLLFGISAMSKLGDFEFDITGEYLILEDFDSDESLDEIITYGCLEGNCDDGNGTYLWPDAKYVGNWKNGLKDGEGVYESKDYTYRGYYLNGLKDGKGYIKFSNGNTYEGILKKIFIMVWEDMMIMTAQVMKVNM